MTDVKNLMKKYFEEAIPFHKLLGIQILEIEKGYAKCVIPFREELLGDAPAKRWHGGVIATAMDGLGGMAGATNMTSYQDKMSTIDLRIDYLWGTTTKDLYVEAEVARNGKRVIAINMKAYHEVDKLVAEGRGVYSIRRKKGEDKDKKEKKEKKG